MIHLVKENRYYGRYYVQPVCRVDIPGAQKFFPAILLLFDYPFKGGLFFAGHSFMLITVFNEKTKKDFSKNN
jgi:hypothetical protein